MVAASHSALLTWRSTVLAALLRVVGHTRAAADELGPHDAECDSPYWMRVRLALAGEGFAGRRPRLARDGGPTNATLARLAAEEAELGFAARGEAVGCDVGRFVLSACRLARSSAEERAWHLHRHFGVGFYALAWRPHHGWPLFRALARLRAQALADPAGTYPTSKCEALQGPRWKPTPPWDFARLRQLASSSSRTPAWPARWQSLRLSGCLLGRSPWPQPLERLGPRRWGACCVWVNRQPSHGSPSGCHFWTFWLGPGLSGS